MQNRGDLPAAARRWARTAGQGEPADSGMGSCGDVYPHTDTPTKGHPETEASPSPPSSFPKISAHTGGEKMLGHPARGRRGFFFLSYQATHVFLYCLISFFSTHGKITQKRGTYFLPNSSRLFDLENTIFLRRAPRAQPAGAGTGPLTSLLAPRPRMSQPSPGKTHS